MLASEQKGGGTVKPAVTYFVSGVNFASSRKKKTRVNLLKESLSRYCYQTKKIAQELKNRRF